MRTFHREQSKMFSDTVSLPDAYFTVDEYDVVNVNLISRSLLPPPSLHSTNSLNLCKRAAICPSSQS